MVMESFSCDFNRNDLGELIEMIRLKMSLNVDAFASLIGTKSKEVVYAEEGMTNACYNILEKMVKNKECNKYFSMQVKFTLK